MGFIVLQSGHYDIVLLIFLTFILTKLARAAIRRRSSPLALLRGPPNTNLIFGILRDALYTEDDGALLENWANEYGSVFKVPTGLGRSEVILCDPKAIAHFHAKDGTTYLRPPFTKALLRALMGDNMLSAAKDDDRRQRRLVAPAFTNSAMQEIMHVFYDATYKLKAHWDTLFESSSDTIIDIHPWMNKLTLDSIGIAGFGHDFRSLDGHKSPVTEAFKSFHSADPFAMRLFMFIGPLFPQIVHFPSGTGGLFKGLQKALSEIAVQLLHGSQGEKESSKCNRHRSILGRLLKDRSEHKDDISLRDEVLGQIGLFIFAGYETAAISISWVLTELACNPNVQSKLRDELMQLSGTDATWDQLISGLPYLDAVIHETLRLHPPVEEVTRVAGIDDTIPLSRPIKLTSGQTVDSIFIPRGTILASSPVYINRCEAFWGVDAKQFIPERWLKENPCDAMDLVGHRRLYTFSDGPRICLGKGFAVAEIKAALSVLIRNFTFEFQNGSETKVRKYRSSLLTRPTIVGENGTALPMRVTQAHVTEEDKIDVSFEDKVKKNGYLLSFE